MRKSGLKENIKAKADSWLSAIVVLLLVGFPVHDIHCESTPRRVKWREGKNEFCTISSYKIAARSFQAPLDEPAQRTWEIIRLEGEDLKDCCSLLDSQVTFKKKNSFMKDFSISQVFSHNSQPLSFCVITGLWISSKPPSGDKVNNPLKLLRCWIFQQSFLPSCLPHSLHWAYLFLQDEQALLSAYETLKAAYDL